ncbi:hypothetical protein FPV67DRAFT_40889 [Lyophyllum atratum]|nr:hypothetical protein FPV67DRAFT_40889 [Lyophyllum atratum]
MARIWKETSSVLKKTAWMKAMQMALGLHPFSDTGKKGRGRPKAPRLKPDDAQALVPPLTITLPAQPPAEETYCYCQQGSFGEMIACDNKKCPIEWYHVGCVGLQTTPEGLKTWYCPDCRPARRGSKRK